MWLSEAEFVVQKGFLPTCKTPGSKCVFLHAGLSGFMCTRFKDKLMFRLGYYTSEDVKNLNIPFGCIAVNRLKPVNCCLEEIVSKVDVSDLELSVLGGMLPNTKQVILSRVPGGLYDAVVSLENKGLLFIYDNVVRLTFLGRMVWDCRGSC